MFGHDNQKDDQPIDNNLPAAQDDNSAPVADAHLDSDGDAHSDDANVIAPDQSQSDNQSPPSSDQPEEPAPADDTNDTPSDDMLTPSDSDDLIAVKQKALQDLGPLVGHLDQTPEEKFKTTMMMIQASDDKSLVQTAYEAAQQITDDKAKAQALLDVINEINYFTHPQNS